MLLVIEQNAGDFVFNGQFRFDSIDKTGLINFIILHDEWTVQN